MLMTPAPSPPHIQPSSLEAVPSSPSDRSSTAAYNPRAVADEDVDTVVLPSLLYDDIDYPATSTTSLLLTAQHNHATQQLHHSIAQLTQQLSHAQQQLHDSRQQTNKYKAQCAVFVRNLSVLYDTAVGEVRRKQEEIDRLKEWKAAHERRTRMAAAERQHNHGVNGGAAVVYSSVSTQQSPLPPVKRAHHAIRQPHLPQPPFTPLDSARKRARVDTG